MHSNQKSGAASASHRVVTKAAEHPCEEDLTKFTISGDDVTVANQFYLLDNKMIDEYYTKKGNFSEEEKELLNE